MWTLDPIVKPLLKLCEIMAVLVGGSVTFALIVAVVLRYVFNYSLGWIDELASLSMAWMMLLISPVGFHEKIHIGVDLFLDKSPRFVRLALETLINLGSIVLFSVAGYYGVFVVQADMGVYLSSMFVLRGPFLLVIPFASGVVILVCVNNIIKLFRHEEGLGRRRMADL